MHRKFLHTANHPSIILVWLFIALLFLVATSLSAQKPLPRPSNNVIYGEAYGVGGFYSVNYERVLFRAWKKKLMVSASIGGSHIYQPEVQSYYFLETFSVESFYLPSSTTMLSLYFEFQSFLIIDASHLQSSEYSFWWLILYQCYSLIVREICLISSCLALANHFNLFKFTSTLEFKGLISPSIYN